MGQGQGLRVCVAHCNRSVLRVQSGEITLFPKCLESLARAAHSAEISISVSIADWPDVKQLAPLGKWAPRMLRGIPYEITEFRGPFNKGLALNQLADASQAGAFLFFLDCDMVVPAEVLRRGVSALEQGKAYFPGYMARTRSGELRRPSTPRHGTGNAFMSREHWAECGRWPEKTTWGQFDRPVSDWFQARGLSAEDLDTREPVSGFIHLWHPRGIGWVTA